MSTILFLAFMAFLYYFCDIDKWWLWFAVIIGLHAQCGYELGMFGLIVAVAVWKVFSDLFRQ